MGIRVAVIPARGGSKRIPRKNIKNFCGQPIIAYSIQAAQESQSFDRIIVSTDDPEIANVSKHYGAEAPFIRPASLSDDYIGTVPVINHAINWLMEHSEDVEYICCIYATAPFVQPKYLQEGYQKLLKSGKSFAFTITTYSFPILRSVRLLNDGSVDAFYPKYVNKRSQDLEEAYHDAGQFYWGRAEAFLNNEILFSHVSMPVLLPRYLVQDIDTPEDWERAELMYRVLEHERNCKMVKP
jgi:pseudaminic acid cytidylyltransferase